MKLVDIDKINNVRIPMMYLDYDRNDWVECKIVTKDTPIVDAIPIDWIRKWAGKNVAETDNCSWNTYTLRLLENWEKEK